MSEGLEIHLHRDRCCGVGQCRRRAPRTFALDADGRVSLLPNPGDPEEEITAAARGCPHFAIDLLRGSRQTD